MLLGIARASLWNRRLPVALTVFTVALSVALLLAVAHLRLETRRSFASTVSGTDLIVGARTGPVQLLLYSVFRIGDASNTIRYSTFEELAALPQVAWAIPISLGDSHHGFRVMGTSTAYFEHFSYGDHHPLEMAAGVPFAAVHEAVLGATVATQLGYRLDDALVIAHGTGNHDIMVHDDQPFRVVGILAPTGTPVDRTVHVSLESIDAIHADWQHGVRIPRGRGGPAYPAAKDAVPQADPDPATKLPTSITAIFVGLQNRAAAFTLQRMVNDYQGEPLLAILPGITLAQLWSLAGVAEAALSLVAICVVIAGLLGMTTALVTTLNERRREMAILRALGARLWQIGALLLIESMLITLAGMALGVLLVVVVLAMLAPWLAGRYGLYVHALAFDWNALGLLLAVFAGGLLAGLVPALLAYRRALADGLTMRT